MKFKLSSKPKVYHMYPKKWKGWNMVTNNKNMKVWTKKWKNNGRNYTAVRKWYKWRKQMTGHLNSW